MSRKIDPAALIALAVLTVAVPFSYAGTDTGVPISAMVIKTLDVNLIEGLKNQKILVLKAKPGDEAQKLLLTAGGGGQPIVVLESNSILPLIKNTYSPASYDGFEVGTFSSTKNVITVVDIQGETVSLKYDSIMPAEYLYLKTTEEDNTKYNFKFAFSIR